jgi:hypothetical protein
VLAETRQKKRRRAKETKGRAPYDGYLYRNIVRFHFIPPSNRKTRNTACKFAGTELIRSQRRKAPPDDGAVRLGRNRCQAAGPPSINLNAARRRVARDA